MQVSPTEGENEGNGRSIIAWVVLLFVLTLAGALPLIVGGINLDNLSQSSPLRVLTAYASTLAALLVAAKTGGVRALLRQVLTWRVGVGWYLLVLIGPIVLILVADLIYIVLGGESPRQWLVFPSNFSFIGPLLAGSLGEEFGWRGFALPRLQKRYSALWASIIIGVIWGTWHLWPVITPGGFAQLTPYDLAQTYIRLISTAIIYGWLYNSTKGSLFLVMIAHAGHNIATELIQIPTTGTNVVPVIIALLYLAAAIAVVLMTGPRTLSRVNDRK